MPNPTPKGLVFSGARARLSIDGQVVGYCTNCSGSEEIQYEAVTTLDNIQVSEFVPVGYTCTFTADRVRLIGDPIRGPGLDVFPKLGNNSQEHLLNILEKADLTVQIEDSVTGQIFMIGEQAKIATHNWTVTARGITGESITFVMVRQRDESES